MILNSSSGNITLSNIGKAALPNFSSVFLSVNVPINASETSRQQKGDAVYDVSSEGTYYQSGFIKVDGSIGYDFSSLTPNIASINSQGEITRINGGIADFKISTSEKLSFLQRVDLSEKSDSSEILDFVSGVEGSGYLWEHMSTGIDSKISESSTINNNCKIFTNQDHSAAPSGTYVRNTNIWSSSIDLTCISPWNSNAGPRKAGTAITKRHVVTVNHLGFTYPVGTTIRFVDSNNNVVERTAVSRIDLLSRDITIFTLDSDLPAEITPCKVFPSNFRSYLTASNIQFNAPPVTFVDQQEKLLIGDLKDVSGGRIGVYSPSSATRANLYENPIGGDSGNPIFALINGELCLMSLWTSNIHGTSYADNISTLNSMIVDADAQAGVSTGYTVTEVSLSDFSQPPP